MPEAAKQIWVRGPAVEAWFKARVLERHAGQAQLTAPRVDIPSEVRNELAQLRRASGISNRVLCETVGIRQPITFYGWEKGTLRPTLTHFEAYMRAIGADPSSDIAESANWSEPPRTNLAGAVQGLRQQHGPRLRSFV